MTVAIKAPEEINPKGFNPKASQTVRVSGNILISDKLPKTPTLEAIDNSLRAVDNPPSVMSCMDVTKGFLATIED